MRITCDKKPAIMMLGNSDMNSVEAFQILRYSQQKGILKNVRKDFNRPHFLKKGAINLQ